MLQNITGSTILWINEYKINGEVKKFYSTSISRKKEDGEYINATLPITFSSNVDTTGFESGEMIEIERAWLTPYTTSRKTEDGNDINAIKLFVDEAFLGEVKQETKPSKPTKQTKGKEPKKEVKILTEKEINDKFNQIYSEKSKGLTSKEKKELKDKLSILRQKELDKIEVIIDEDDLPF